jgi:hypothetical protein
MRKEKCKYADECPVFEGKVKKTDKPLFLYHNIFCYAGSRGFNACKRYQVYELGVNPPISLLPENEETLEKIITKL